MIKDFVIKTYIDGTVENDSVFIDANNPIEVGQYTYTAQRMGAVPSISATIKSFICLDSYWDKRQYIVYNNERYFVFNTPTSSKKNTDGRYEYTVTFHSERYELNGVYFFDVVGEDSSMAGGYISNSTTFSFLGDIAEFAGRLQATLDYNNIDYTVIIDNGISSEAVSVSFDNIYILDALQQSFDLYDIPHYFKGREIHFGYTDNAITEVFEYGSSLLEITKTNANYKQITYCSGIGSEENIPYYYPNLTDSSDINDRLPTVQNLMPTIFRTSKTKERFYPAKNNTYLLPDGSGDYYHFDNEYQGAIIQQQVVQKFEDIKPTIEGITNSKGEVIATITAFAYDDNDNDDLVLDDAGNATDTYQHPYFYIKLKMFDGAYGFNLFASSIDSGEMTINMRSGNLAGTSHIIQSLIQESDGRYLFYNPVQVGEDGNLVDGDWGNKINTDISKAQEQQQNTQTNEIWIAVTKDINTFGVLMPNVSNNYKPTSGDSFNITNIFLPQGYITAAEKRLEDAIIQYMWENNSEKFNFTIKFSRVFLAENPNILSQLNENARLAIKYDNKIITSYISNYTYKSPTDTEPLPEITVTITDTISVQKGALQNSLTEVKNDILSSFGGSDFLKQGLKYFVRKDVDDTVRGQVYFDKGIKSKNYNDIPRLGYNIFTDSNGRGIVKANVIEAEELIVDVLTHNKIQAISGTFVISRAWAKVARTEGNANGDTVFYYIPDDGLQQWRVADQPRMANAGRFFWGVVTEVSESPNDEGEHYMICSSLADNIIGSISSVRVNDDLVLFGHRGEDIDRQNLTIMTSGSSDNPYPSYEQLFGINSFDLSNLEYRRPVSLSRKPTLGLPGARIVVDPDDLKISLLGDVEMKADELDSRPPSPAIQEMGLYVDGETYYKNQRVTLPKGTLYLCLATTTDYPSQESTDWMLQSTDYDSDIKDAIDSLATESSNLLFSSYLPLPTSNKGGVDVNGMSYLLTDYTAFPNLLKALSASPLTDGDTVTISIRCKVQSVGGTLRVYLNSQNSYMSFDKEVSTQWQTLHCTRTINGGVAATDILHLAGTTPDWLSDSNRLSIQWITMSRGAYKSNLYTPSLRESTANDANLMVNSNIPFSNSNYLLAQYRFGSELLSDYAYATITVKGALGEGKTALNVYNSSGGNFIGQLVASDFIDGVAQKTFRWLSRGTANNRLDLYAFPSGVSVESSVSWVKVTKGIASSLEWFDNIDNLKSQLDAANSALANVYTKSEADGKISESEAKAISDATVEAKRLDALVKEETEDLVKNSTQKVTDDLNTYKSTVSEEFVTVMGEINNIHSQIDGTIMSFSGTDIPTLSNSPANEWVTDEQKEAHVNDTYSVLDKVDGEDVIVGSYKFSKVDNVYKWVKLSDSDAAAAIALAQQAWDLAGSKNRVFQSATAPLPPYEVGDIWVNSTTLAIYLANTTSNNGTANDSHWRLINSSESRLNVMANNLIFSIEEKPQMQDMRDQIVIEYTKYLDDAGDYDVPIGALQPAYDTLIVAFRDIAKIDYPQDTPITEEQHTAFNTAVATYYSERTKFANTIAQKLADVAVDNLQIGGVNLLNDTALKSGNGNDWIVSLGDFDIVTLKEGDSITLSFICNNVTDNGVRAMLPIKKSDGTYLSDHFGALAFTGDKAVVVFTATQTCTVKRAYLMAKSTSDSIGVYEVAHIMLERGNKPSEWRESQNDTDTKITEIKEVADAAQADIAAMNSNTIFDITEKHSIRDDWYQIQGAANTSEAAEVGGSYYNAMTQPNGNAEEDDVTEAKAALTAAYIALRTELTRVELYVDANTANFDRDKLSSLFAAYHNALQEVYKVVSKGNQGDKGDQGDGGIGVSSTDVEYAISSSATIAPTSGWQTTAPAWQDGKYIWQRVRTVYSNNTSVTSTPVNLTGSKGATGSAGSSVTILSTSVTYAKSTSGTTAPTSGWTSAVPSVPQGEFLWTKTFVDYSSGTDTTSYSVTRVGIDGSQGDKGDNGTSVTIVSTSITYKAHTSATTAPTSGWSTSIPTVSQGQFLWTKTQVNYSDGKNTISYAVSRQGQDGAVGTAGKGISTITNYYLASALASGVTTSTSGWTTSVQNPSASKKYLWNYEKVTFTDNSVSSTTPSIIGNYATDGLNGSDGSDGKGISSIVEYYAINNSTTAPTSGFSTTVQTPTAGNRYLWNYEVVNYTTGSPYTSAKRIIGVYGEKGSTGETGDTGVGISSVTEEYYLSDSKTTQTGGNWSTTMPTWSSGKYVWIRSKITYTNNTVEYAGLFVDSSWEAVNELVIAGDNLLKNSQLLLPDSNGAAMSTDGYPTSSNTTTFFNGLLEYCSRIPANEDFVITIRCKASSGGGLLRAYLNSQNGYLPFDKDVTTGWQELSCKRTLNGSIAANDTLHLQALWASPTSLLYIHWITLRVGNTIVKWWSAAPNDTAALIEAAKDSQKKETIHFRSTSSVELNTPQSPQQDDYVPSGWLDDFVGVTLEYPYDYISERTKKDGVWSAFSKPGLFAKLPREVVDTKQEFAVSTSETTAPTTGWSEKAPERVPNAYLWVRVTNIYANGWENIVGTYVDTTWQSLDDLEIAAPNLLLDSFRPMPSTSKGALYSDNYPYINAPSAPFPNLLSGIRGELTDGVKVTISMRCKARTVGGTVKVYLNSANSYESFTTNATTSWQVISCTRVISGSVTAIDTLHLTGDWISSEDVLFIDWIDLKVGSTPSKTHTLSAGDSSSSDINLVEGSDESVTNANYLNRTLKLTPSELSNGQMVTVVVKATLGDGKEGFALYNSGSNTYLATIPSSSFVNGVAKVSFRWNTSNSSNTSLWLYATPSSATSSTTISWVKLVKGYVTSGNWSPSAEDTKRITLTSILKGNTQEDIELGLAEMEENGVFYADSVNKTVYINAAYIRYLANDKAFLQDLVVKKMQTDTGNVIINDDTVIVKGDIWGRSVNVEYANIGNSLAINPELGGMFKLLPVGSSNPYVLYPATTEGETLKLFFFGLSRSDYGRIVFASGVSVIANMPDPVTGYYFSESLSAISYGAKVCSIELQWNNDMWFVIQSQGFDLEV